MKNRKQPIRVTVVPSTEAIDVDAWVDRYVAVLLESQGYRLPQQEAA